MKQPPNIPNHLWWLLVPYLNRGGEILGHHHRIERQRQVAVRQQLARLIPRHVFNSVLLCALLLAIYLYFHLNLTRQFHSHWFNVFVGVGLTQLTIRWVEQRRTIHAHFASLR